MFTKKDTEKVLFVPLFVRFVAFVAFVLFVMTRTCQRDEVAIAFLSIASNGLSSAISFSMASVSTGTNEDMFS